MNQHATPLVVLAAALALPAFAETPAPSATRSPEALAILQRVDAATKAVDAVSYSAKAVPSGIATNFVSAAEGKAVLAGWNGQQPQKFRIDIKTTRRGTDEPLELSGGGDGESYFLVDHQARKAYEDMDPGVMGRTGRSLQAIMMVEFVHDKPFDDELAAETVELLGSEAVNGEDCNKIRVVYAGGRGESIWYFAKSDDLPRRRVRKFNVPNQGEGQLEFTLSDLQVAPKIDAAQFKLALPAGYQRIDDFAP